jgi:hypothetical protein
VRCFLRRHPRTTHDAPTTEDRRNGRLGRLSAAGVALFALAAAPMSHAASEGVPDAVAAAVSTTVTTLASTTLEAATSGASHGVTASEDRAVRTAVATPVSSEEHASLRLATAQSDEADEPAEEADPQAADEDAPDADDADGADGADVQDASAERSVWDRLADCESGDWVNGGESFVEGSARWDYGIDFAHEGYEQFQGGLNFHPGTWDAYRDPEMPGHAGNASREQEIVVAERVLASQGWGAWPRCTRMLGLR